MSILFLFLCWACLVGAALVLAIGLCRMARLDDHLEDRADMSTYHVLARASRRRSGEYGYFVCAAVVMAAGKRVDIVKGRHQAVLDDD